MIVEMVWRLRQTKGFVKSSDLSAVFFAVMRGLWVGRSIILGHVAQNADAQEERRGQA